MYNVQLSEQLKLKVGGEAWRRGEGGTGFAPHGIEKSKDKMCVQQTDSLPAIYLYLGSMADTSACHTGYKVSLYIGKETWAVEVTVTSFSSLKTFGVRQSGKRGDYKHMY